MDALALERVELELVLFGSVWAVELLSDVVFGVEHLVDAVLLLSFHDDLNIFRFYLL